MKFLVAVSLASCAAVVFGELCSSPSDCMLTMCDDNATVICERGECTCLMASTDAPSTGETSCTQLSDCNGLPHCHSDSAHGPTGQHGHEWHCIDGVCRCAGFHP